MKRHAIMIASLSAAAFAPVGLSQEAPPQSMQLTGVVHDFIQSGAPGGHPDFQVVPAGGYGHYMGNIANELDAESKPVFVGGGHKVYSQWRNANGQAINPAFYNAALGDSAGSLSGTVDPGGIHSADTFAQWYRDVPGVNLSEPYTITLTRSGGTDQLPIFTYQNNSFFPIDNQLLGNSHLTTPDHNFSFTFELHTTFTFKQGAGQVFSFYGDDDVWVFINKHLVIDIGGVHSQVNQIVELDRLGLEDNKSYPLDFFFAERHTTESHFRIDTTLQLLNADLPTVSAAYD